MFKKMPISMKAYLLVLTFLVASLDALNPTDPGSLSMLKELQREVKKQGNAVKILQNYIVRQEDVISGLQQQEKRQDERLLQQEHVITTLRKQGRRQDIRLIQQEHMLGTLREQGQQQVHRLLQQESVLTALREQGKQQDQRLLQQEIMLTTLREQEQQQDQRLLQQEHLLTALLREQGRRHDEFLNNKLQEQGQRQNTTLSEIFIPLQFNKTLKNQKKHITKKDREVAPNSSDPFSDISGELPANYIKGKKPVLSSKVVARKVPMPALAIRASGRAVAFEVKLNTQISHLGLNQPIVFDQIVLNLGKAYSELHGTFTAPRTGVYIFSTSVMVAAVEIETQIVKNGQFIAGALAQGIGSNDQGSVTVVAMLEPGDQVWVSNTWPADTTVWGKGYSSFMGCLVVEI